MDATYPQYWKLAGDVLSPIRDDITVDTNEEPINFLPISHGETISNRYTQFDENFNPDGLIYLPANPAINDIYSIIFTGVYGGLLSANGRLINGLSFMKYKRYDYVTLTYQGNNVWFTLNISDNHNTLQAGEVLSTLDLCYLKSDGQYWKANAAAAATMPACVIAAEPTIGGGFFSFHMPGSNILNFNWTWTPGQLLYASATAAGGITAVTPANPGDQVQVIGYASSATSIFFNPSYVTVEIS